MVTVFDYVHTDDLDIVGRSAYHNVRTVQINQERVRARLNALTQESIERTKKYAIKIGTGKEAEASD